MLSLILLQMKRCYNIIFDIMIGHLLSSERKSIAMDFHKLLSFTIIFTFSYYVSIPVHSALNYRLVLSALISSGVILLVSIICTRVQITQALFVRAYMRYWYEYK